jgi:hypothetical protein
MRRLLETWDTRHITYSAGNDLRVTIGVTGGGLDAASYEGASTLLWDLLP